MYVRGKLLKQARKHAEMAVMEKLEGSESANHLRISTSVQLDSGHFGNNSKKNCVHRK